MSKQLIDLEISTINDLKPNSRNLIVSNHYQHDAGAHYVAYHQSDPHCIGYQVDLDYFIPYLQANDTVLDFGCGNGGMLGLLGKLVKRAEGLEVNPHARKYVYSSGMHVYADLGGLPTTPVFNVVVSNHVLEHIRDVCGTLEQLKPCIKPGGLLLLKLPMEDWRARAQRVPMQQDIDHHLQTWTPRLIANVLRETGYRVEEVRVVTSAWHPRLFWLRKLGMDRLAYWALAVILKRRQLFVVGRVPE